MAISLAFASPAPILGTGSLSQARRVAVRSKGRCGTAPGRAARLLRMVTEQPQAEARVSGPGDALGSMEAAEPAGMVEPAAEMAGTAEAEDATGMGFDPEAVKSQAWQALLDVWVRPALYAQGALYVGIGLVTLTVVNATLSAINALPLLPNLLELVGLAYTVWFVWRYLLFAESRDELMEEVDEFIGKTKPQTPAYSDTAAEAAQELGSGPGIGEELGYDQVESANDTTTWAEDGERIAKMAEDRREYWDLLRDGKSGDIPPETRGDYDDLD